MLLGFLLVPNTVIRSADIIQTLSWDTLDAWRPRDKSTRMYKILNDDTAPNIRNSFVRRNVDQTDYHLRNSATDLTLPEPKREFLKQVLNIAAQCFGTNSQMRQNKRNRYIHLINVSKRNWVMSYHMC